MESDDVQYGVRVKSDARKMMLVEGEDAWRKCSDQRLIEEHLGIRP